MNSPSFSSTLYDCATECALRRQKGRCKNVFGSMACLNCNLNIHRYIDADPRHIELFMLQAETRSSAIRSSGNLHRLVFMIVILFCLYSSYRSYQAEQSRIQRRSEQSIVTAQATPQSTPRTAVQASSQAASSSNTIQMIETALRRVADDIRNNVDVNRDGLVNCIDAAVLFYQYYPNKNQVTISVNRNRATGMHHLFNVVLVNGVWRAVEPQAFFAGKSSFWMRDIWGSEYDSNLNRVVTEDYLRFVR